MLLLGAFAGVMSEAVDRKRILLIGQIVSGTWLRDDRGARRVRHRAARGTSALAALLAGTVWSTEMSTRRRMVGECVAGALVPRALALDTVTNSITRLIGPMAGGAAYQALGLAGAYGNIGRASTWSRLILVAGLDYQQTSRQDRAVAMCRATSPKRSRSPAAT